MQAYGTVPPRKGVFTGQNKMRTNKMPVQKKMVMKPRPGTGMMNRGK